MSGRGKGNADDKGTPMIASATSLAISSQASRARLRIRLFGSLLMSIDDRPVEGLYRRKAGQLLAALVLRTRREVPRVALAELLWPDQALLEGDVPRALESLRQSASHLRKVLAGEAWRLSAPSPRTLSFDVSGADVDLIAFERLAACKDLEALQYATKLYLGPLLE